MRNGPVLSIPVRLFLHGFFYPAFFTDTFSPIHSDCMLDNSPKKNDRPLFLLSAEWPYGTGENFLSGEIPYLLDRFSNLYVLPMFSHGLARPTDPRITIIESTPPSDYRISDLLRGVSCSGGLFGPEWRNSPGYPFSHHSFYLTARSLGIARRIEQRILHSVNKNRLKQGLIYSYWMNQACMGGILAAKNLQWPVVSRAHGGDLYTERHRGNYLPWHRWKAHNLDHIFPVSHFGSRYLSDRYPEIKDRIHVHYLGTAKSEKGIRRPGESDSLHLVSCSSIIPLKRVELILETVVDLYRQLKDDGATAQARIRWTHIGDGPGFGDLKEKARPFQHPDLQVDLLGRMEPELITEFYIREKADLFINYSTTEGIPVSIMEAFSCGIPAAAPETGGIPEIVNRDTGILFGVDEHPAEVAGKLKAVFAADSLVKMGGHAYSMWRNKFDMDKNYRGFSDFLDRV